MRLMLFLLAVFSFSAAAVIPLTVFEQRDMGVEYDEVFDDVYVTMDCEENVITVYIKQDDKPVTGAVVRILYVDYSVPLLASGPTDIEGKLTYKLVGERNFMTGIFLVIVEKEGYRNKEAHFDIAQCIEGVEEIEEEVTPPPPPPEVEPEEEPEEEIEEVETPPSPPPKPPEEIEEIPPSPEENVTGAEENVTGEAEEAAPLCPLSSLLVFFPLLLILSRW